MNTVPLYSTSSQIQNIESIKAQKIAIEKRKRRQVYVNFDYLNKSQTYFDFFSFDAFQLAHHAKWLTDKYGLEYVTSEFFLFCFLISESEIADILAEYGIEKDKIREIIYDLNEEKLIPAFNAPIKEKIEIFFEKRQADWEDFVQFLDYFSFYIFSTLFTQSKITYLDPSVQFSYEVSRIFEKSVENALIRFKTPIITPEIIFVTMMEEKTNKISKIIRRLIVDPIDWYVLRYRLIKRIHQYELDIRMDIIKNEQYFAYLLKTYLPEYQVNQIIEYGLFPVAVYVFRNTAIPSLIKSNLSTFLHNEIHHSIEISNQRNYSF